MHHSFKLYYDFELPKDRKLKPCRIKTPENGEELFLFFVENDVSFFWAFFQILKAKSGKRRYYLLSNNL